MARKKKAKPQQRRRTIEVNVEKLDELVNKTAQELLSEAEREVLRTSIHAMAAQLVSKPRNNEKATALGDQSGTVGSAAGEGGAASDDKSSDEDAIPGKKPRPGHGRNGAKDYVGTTVVKTIPIATLTPKCLCPGCQQGKVYPLKEPKILVRVVGMPPIQATRYELQQLRCNLCGEIYTAQAPAGIGEDKYDASVASMLAVLRYGSGMPWYRIEKLEQQMGIPLPQATQWDLVNEAANKVLPVHQELVRQGAQGSVMYRDDTKVRILEEVDRPEGQAKDRTGLNTTGIVSKTLGEHLIALFVSGPQHAGENMCDLLDERQEGAPSPTLMGDALSSNDKLPPGFEAVLCNCLTHGRRQFVNVYDSFPDDCRYVIDEIGHVYWHDEQAREQGMDDEQRLKFHQAQSKPVMDRLKTWMQAQFDEKRVEKNSGLGKAINYFLKRWDKLTRFLEHPGAPLDSNIVERALKKAVLQRKNSLFYKTQHGADVGDLFLSLIHTCELNHVHAFQYLTELQRHADEVRTNPSAWLPWNYHVQLQPPAPD